LGREAGCTYKHSRGEGIVQGVKVTEIMSRPVITVSPRTPLKEAAQLLVEHGISALPVLDEKAGLVGIVSEADLVPIEARPDPRSQSTPLPPTAGRTPRTVAEVMTRNVITVTAGSEVSQAARAMLEAGVKRVPVMRGRHVVGVVSRRDLVRVIARQDGEVRDELARRLLEAGIDGAVESMTVRSGVATIELPDRGPARRLAESLGREVPGVLEIRFITPRK
jgi:CBS domain-containing protein